MQRGTFGTALKGAVSPTTQQKEAMERPSAWARDEDLEEGRRLHNAKAVSALSLVCIRCQGALIPIAAVKKQMRSA